MDFGDAFKNLFKVLKCYFLYNFEYILMFMYVLTGNMCDILCASLYDCIFLKSFLIYLKLDKLNILEL